MEKSNKIIISGCQEFLKKGEGSPNNQYYEAILKNCNENEKIFKIIRGKGCVKDPLKIMGESCNKFQFNEVFSSVTIEGKKLLLF